MTEKEYIEQVVRAADTYEQTIQTIICFDAAVRWDDKSKQYAAGSHFMPGRRMSKAGRIPPDDVTPDVVSQLSDSYGIVGEVKLTASTQQDFDKAFRQVANYDQELVGWITPNEEVALHDISLIVDDFNRNAALRNSDKVKLTRNLSLVATALELRSRNARKIEKYSGHFSDERLEAKFRDPVPIVLEPLAAKLSSVKFCDANPPSVEYTMNVLWLNAFNELCQQQKRGVGWNMVSVNCTKLTQMLHERYAFPQNDKRQPKLPRKQWVTDALNAFVRIGYATRKGEEEYEVQYTPNPRHGSQLAVFAKKVWKAQAKVPQRQEIQLELLAEDTKK